MCIVSTQYNQYNHQDQGPFPNQHSTLATRMCPQIAEGWEWIPQGVIRFSDVCNKHRRYFKLFAKNDFSTMFQSSCPKWLLTRNKEMPCLNCRLIEMGEMACYQVVPAKIIIVIIINFFTNITNTVSDRPDRPRVSTLSSFVTKL